MTQHSWPGDPAAAWRRTPADGPAPSSRRRNPPDLSDFETFTRLLPRRGEYLAMPVMYGVGGAFCLAVGLHLMRYQRPLDPFDGSAPAWLGLIAYWPPWFLLLGLGVAGLCWAPVSYVRGKRDHPRYLRELYERINREGIMVQTFLSTLRLEANEGTDPSRIAIETRAGDAQAGRLHAAFHTWLDVLRHDDDAREAAQKRIGSRRVLPATELFGPEAEGGYLLRASSISQWQVLLPDGPTNWQVEPVRNER
ncbi:hypothetical protein [Jiangella alba]|uniref:Uncharacterized protein n=1 Tax=Jiangella alba TaxID=561176 RepID=A0A1H5K6G6_9ACTN|nr:hypothetical protein [Jiangella alba]SEE60436.1 hypothetical protein SAMN04488561_1921 [Jiangella alba]